MRTKSLMLPRLLPLLLGLLLPKTAHARLANDGSCDLAIFPSFTYVSSEIPYECAAEGCINVGWSHLVGAGLAMEHFNHKDASVVPELADYIDCPLYLDWNRSVALDTGTYTHQAAQSLLQHVAAQNDVPCAVVGPFHDRPALELSTLGAAWDMAVLPHRSFNLNVAATFHSPYTTQVYPHLISSAAFCVHYLYHQLERTNFIAVLFPLSDTGLHVYHVLSALMDELGIDRHKDYSYNSLLLSPASSENRNIDVVVARVKASGFRTIILSTDSPYLEVAAVAKEAVKQGLVNGDFLWILFGDYDVVATGPDADEDVRNFLEGCIWISPADGFFMDPVNDPFLKAWRATDASLLKKIRELSNQNVPGNWELESLADLTPEFGTSYMYDAVMTAAMGTCNAIREQSLAPLAALPIAAQVAGIRKVDFTGAFGGVAFYESPDKTHFLRNSTGTPHVILNVWPPGTDSPVVPIAVMYDVSPSVYEAEFFIESLNSPIFANGESTPPAILRDVPVQYLQTWVRIFGLTATGIALLAAASGAAWVYWNRNHRILQAAQPQFLYVICAGTSLMVASIIPMSFDERQGWSQQNLDLACATLPWLVIVGSIMVFGALFSKLWRVQRVLQFSRRTIKIKHVVWPVAILMSCALIILTLMTALDPPTWTHVEVDEESGEVLGTCEMDHPAAFIPPLVIVVLIPAVLTELMAWKTKDVDDAYSESNWIFIMILVQLEVLIFAIPMILLLSDISVDGQYIGITALTWVFGVSPVGLILGPKVWAHRRAVSGAAAQAPKRGAGGTGAVQVSGLRPAHPPGAPDMLASLATPRVSWSHKNSTEHPPSGPEEPAGTHTPENHDVRAPPMPEGDPC